VETYDKSVGASKRSAKAFHQRNVNPLTHSTHVSSRHLWRHTVQRGVRNTTTILRSAAMCFITRWLGVATATTVARAATSKVCIMYDKADRRRRDSCLVLFIQHVISTSPFRWIDRFDRCYTEFRTLSLSPFALSFSCFFFIFTMGNFVQNTHRSCTQLNSLKFIKKEQTETTLTRKQFICGHWNKYETLFVNDREYIGWTDQIFISPFLGRQLLFYNKTN